MDVLHPCAASADAKKREDLINIHELITIAILTSKNGFS